MQLHARHKRPELFNMMLWGLHIPVHKLPVLH